MVLVILLVKVFHCLLLCTDTPCGLAVALSIKVGLGERGGLWPEGSDPLIVETIQGVGGDLTAC